jgi:hypothetical protein
MTSAKSTVTLTISPPYHTGDEESTLEPDEEYADDDDDDDDGQLGSFANQMLDSMKKSKFDVNDKDFLPASFFETPIPTDTIERELGLGPGGDPDLVNWIRKDSKKLFAVNVLCMVKGNLLLESMKFFREHNYTDAKLPLLSSARRLVSFSREVWGEKLMRQLFLEKQWAVLAPVFGYQYDYTLSEHSILPFIHIDAQSKHGSFGEVYHVEIHSAHCLRPIPSTV